MKISKSLLSAGVVSAVAFGSIAGVSAVSAHNGGGGNTGEAKDELISRIATDTGADKETVEASFQAHRDAKKAEHQQARSEHLDGLVGDGTITQDQREALEAKFAEQKATKEDLKDQDLSREQMHELKKESRDEFKKWAEEQGINLDDIRPEHDDNHRGRGQKIPRQ